MNIRRVLILLSNDLIHGSKTFIFIWVILGPILISLLFSLIFGTLITDKPRIVIFDQGSSELVLKLENLDSIILKICDSSVELKNIIEKGGADIGLVLPSDFDSQFKSGKRTKIEVFVWGESLAKNRILGGTILASKIRELSGLDIPVTIETAALGNVEAIPWKDRLFPLVVLMTVFLGGLFLPATSLIEEKAKRTLQAIIVTPTSLLEVFFSKGLMGIIVSVLMGIIILIINQAFGNHPWLLILLIFLGSIMAAVLGLISGAFIKDVTTLFSIWKSFGILLFFPAIMYIFPKIPKWIGKLFPTNYLIEPIVELSQKGGGWVDIRTDIYLLIGIDFLLILLLIFIIKKLVKQGINI